jgi:tRNA A-37 threonylcarbamoyl transferase component Bud32
MASKATSWRLDGNRIWRVPDSQGALVQKLYAGRKDFLRRFFRNLGLLFFPLVSSATATGRWQTERSLLRTWREAGIDVPRDLTDEHPEFAGPRVTVMEYVEGEALGNVLRNLDQPREERDELLRRFAAMWGTRHGLALKTGRPEFVQAHATILHVMVAGDRLVTIDLERHQHSRHILPLLAREIGNYLRTLLKRVPEDVFRRDLAAIVDGYPHREILVDAIGEMRRSPNLLRRLGWAMDRQRKIRRHRKKSKFVAMELLAEALSGGE